MSYIRTPNLSLAVLAVVLAVISVQELRAQSSCLDAADEPHHSVIFKNNAVRILELQLGRLKSTEVHCHSNSYLVVITTESRTTDGVSSHDWTRGEARFIYGPVTQTIRNEEMALHRQIEVETLRTVPAVPYTPFYSIDAFGPDLGDLKPTWSMSFTRGGLTATKTQLATGDSWDVNPPDHILIAVTDLELQKRGSGDEVGKISLDAGDTLILPGGSVSRLTNTNRDKARFVTVEF